MNKQIYVKLELLYQKNLIFIKVVLTNNLFNGKSLLISKNGYYYFWDWNKGKCNGKGIIISKDNKTLYEGDFKNNKKNWKRLEHFSDDLVYVLENLKIIKMMEKENIFIKMYHIMMENLLMIYLMEMENIFGTMEKYII